MTKGPFSPENIKKALDRVPATATKTLRMWRERAHAADSEKQLTKFIEAVDAELARRPFDVDDATARANAAWSEATADLPLEEAVRYAFGQARPATLEERQLLKTFAEFPGISAEECTKRFGDDGMSLYLGHLVYDRYGCFRHLLPGLPDQSSVLVRKEKIGGRRHH